MCVQKQQLFLFVAIMQMGSRVFQHASKQYIHGVPWSPESKWTKKMKIEISMKSVKLLTFMGTHVAFQTWWFHFWAFATVWKFTAAIGKVPEVETASLSMTTVTGRRWQRSET